MHNLSNIKSLRGLRTQFSASWQPRPLPPCPRPRPPAGSTGAGGRAPHRSDRPWGKRDTHGLIQVLTTVPAGVTVASATGSVATATIASSTVATPEGSSAVTPAPIQPAAEATTVASATPPTEGTAPSGAPVGSGDALAALAGLGLPLVLLVLHGAPQALLVGLSLAQRVPLEQLDHSPRVFIGTTQID